MARQLPLPQAPVLDETGLHAIECACPRCESGYRPTTAQREIARRAHWEAGAHRRATERETERETERRVREARRRAETDAEVKKLREAAEKARPLSLEEINQMRAECGLPKRRK